MVHLGKDVQDEPNNRGKERTFFLFSFFFLFIFFLGPYLWPMAVPRLGGPIRAVAASLLHSHSNTGSKPHLQCTP